MALIFNEESLINGNIYKFENRLVSAASKYIANSAILTTYYSLRDNATTVDRGLQDIEELFGNKSPLRFNKIKNFPLYDFPQANPNNTDEIGIEDITLEGECIVLPSTIVPNPNDFFILNHLKMIAVFQVADVQHDSMKSEGYYKIRYRLHSTSTETLDNLEKQVVEKFNTELDALGTNINPIIQEDDFVLRRQIKLMVNKMIQSYHSLFYNKRHNCFLYSNLQDGTRWFDLCGNEFMAKHNVMNMENSPHAIVLHDKLRDNNLLLHMNTSIYSWIELGCPKQMLQKFHFNLTPVEDYKESSFFRWGDSDIQVIRPISLHHLGPHNRGLSYFGKETLEAFLDENVMPVYEDEKLIWKFINTPNSISIHDVSLTIANTLISSISHIRVFFYTPILIYIIRKILQMN